MLVFYVSLECLSSASIVLWLLTALFFGFFLQSDVLFELLKIKTACRIGGLPE
ncbi:hypothetical protein [Kingella denitrificans]